MKCPNCGENSITVWQKLNMRPAYPIVCKSCGKKITVPKWYTYIYLIPSAIFMYLAVTGRNRWLSFVFFIAGVVILPAILSVVFLPMELYGEAGTKKKNNS